MKTNEEDFDLPQQAGNWIKSTVCRESNLSPVVALIIHDHEKKIIRVWYVISRETCHVQSIIV